METNRIVIRSPKTPKIAVQNAYAKTEGHSFRVEDNDTLVIEGFTVEDDNTLVIS